MSLGFLYRQKETMDAFRQRSPWQAETTFNIICV